MVAAGEMTPVASHCLATVPSYLCWHDWRAIVNIRNTPYFEQLVKRLQFELDRFIVQMRAGVTFAVSPNAATSALGCRRQLCREANAVPQRVL